MPTFTDFTGRANPYQIIGSISRLGAALALSIGLLACGGSDPDTTWTGPAQSIGNGTARAFVTLSAAGTPVAIGFTMTEETLFGLPTANRQHLLALPAEAATATVFDHLSIDWGPAGHVPAGVFDRPHFDMHFYMISQAERATIAAAPDEAPPPVDVLPPGYVSGRLVVPAMGQHWNDSSDPNTSPGSFSHTMMYGFSKGRMVFLEPMVTHALLLSKQSTSTEIKHPKVFQKRGFYPTRYSIRFDPIGRAHVVTLDQMVER